MTPTVRLLILIATGAVVVVHAAAIAMMIAPAAAVAHVLGSARWAAFAVGTLTLVTAAAMLVRRRQLPMRGSLGLATLAVLLLVSTQYGCSKTAHVKPAPVQERVEEGQRVFDHARLDAVLGTFVDEFGMVDYAALKARRADLDAYVGQLATASPRSNPELFPTPAHRMAYWMNAYNALMLRAVVDAYPIKSITDIMVAHGVFSRLSFIVGGKEMTLDDIEKGILLKEHDAALAHFGVTCASLGCPRLQRSAWRAERLEERLHEATRVYLSSRFGVQLDPERNTVKLTSYFKWYGGDFGNDHLGFVRRYLDDDRQRVLDSMSKPSIEHISYDWRLNDRAAPWRVQ
ncbi:MAG: DUF547 domain-containing protein [Myxococcota bacterium]|nr:DUF547 domain-containing protein [Deltaproteobacteria bacterium]MDQ3335715.1 DUF547 domain-containing protein [Myxococcota bacterium]